MLYNYFFDVASLIMAVFLVIVYAIRRTLRTTSNRYLLVLLLVDCVGAFCDIISCFCISYPTRYSMWFNYLMCNGYLFFYNLMGILFFAYIDSKTKMAKVYVPVKIYIRVAAIFEFILIFTSPWTHLVSYFDENIVYCHGPLMMLLYLLAASHLTLAALFFFLRRRRFNKYQVMSIISFIFSVFIGVFIQFVFPRLLVGQFGCTLVLFFIYTSLENPVYHTYSQSTCYNRLAFREIMKMKVRDKEKFGIFAFAIRDFASIQERLSIKNAVRLSNVIAEFIATRYRENAFAISDDKFVIIAKNERKFKDIEDALNIFFSKEIMLVDDKIEVSINTVVLSKIDISQKADTIEAGLIYCLEHNLASDKNYDFDQIVADNKRRRAVATVVERAIDNNLFDVYYQPIINTNTGKFQSCEALIRLIDKDLGFVSPEEFIPIAEREGLIVKIGDIVFEKVCKFINESQIISKYGVKYVEINLSTIQCVAPDLISKFTAVMEKYSIKPEWINLEITETAGFEQNEQMLKNIDDFHRMGVTFSIDDYGSGFASADYLCKLPVDIVKIDKGILWQAMKEAKAGIVLIGTIKMLKTLGKKIVVEGVENEEMVRILEDNGCDYMQGYFYSRPIPGKDYIEFLKDKTKDNI